MGAIEQLIKQKEFESEHQKLAISTMYLANVINTETQDFLKEFDITLQQFNTLRILRGRFPEPATQAYIKERLIDNSSDVSRLVERLKQKEYVRLSPCMVDGRAKDIFITQKGLDLLSNVDLNKDRLFGSLSCLSIEEAKQLNDIMDKALSKQIV